LRTAKSKSVSFSAARLEEQGDERRDAFKLGSPGNELPDGREAAFIGVPQFRKVEAQRPVDLAADSLQLCHTAGREPTGDL